MLKYARVRTNQYADRTSAGKNNDLILRYAPVTARLSSVTGFYFARARRRPPFKISFFHFHGADGEPCGVRCSRNCQSVLTANVDLFLLSFCHSQDPLHFLVVENGKSKAPLKQKNCRHIIIDMSAYRAKIYGCTRKGGTVAHTKKLVAVRRNLVARAKVMQQLAREMQLFP